MSGKGPVWGMEPHTHLYIFNPELLLSNGNAGAKSGAETEGKAIQRLPHLGIHIPHADTKPRHYC